MPKPVAVVFLLTLATCISSFAGFGIWHDGSEVYPGRLIVSFSPPIARVLEKAPRSTDGLVRTDDNTLDEIFEEFGVWRAVRLVPDGILDRLRVPPDFYHTFVVFFREEYPVDLIVERLMTNPQVEEVEPDRVARAFRTPNDQYWADQWDKRIMGADEVWDVTTGSRAIICAGIDTGVDWNHPDLVGSMWINPGEDSDGDRLLFSEPTYPGDYDDIDGQDSDGNGYIDDFLGWDFVVGIHNCAPGEDCDNNMDNNMFGINSHGTHVAGIMCATGNNTLGVAGMSWVGSLMCLRAGWQSIENQGLFTESTYLPAILYAAAMGARIINMSFGGPGSSGMVQQTINSAWNQGALLVAASGNDGLSTPQYPAGYNNVIAVNATDDRDHLASWSNRGTWTELCAPGSDPGIMSTINNGYAAYWGTSMASPNAAGAAALVWSLFPNMTNDQIRDLMFNSAQDISFQNPGVPPGHLGHGRVDAEAAAASLAPRLRITTVEVLDTGAGDGDGRLESGESAQLRLSVTNDPGWANGDDISIIVTADSPYVVVTDSTSYLGDIPAGQTINNSGDPVGLTAAPSIEGVHDLPLTVTFQSPNGYRMDLNIRIRVNRGHLLIVDDDGGDDYQRFYAAAVDSAGLTSDLWNTAIDGAVSAGELNHYNTLLWICGNEQSSTLTVADQSSLSSYLDSGRNLILVGQNIDEDLASSAFYSNYLHAQSASATGNRELTGIIGNSISHGMSLRLTGAACAGNGNLSPSRINPLNGAVAVFDYTQGGTGAVAYAASYRLVYFAFALEAACRQGNFVGFEDVIASTLHWIGTLNTPPDRRVPLPERITLRGNYPNPFNATTIITFEVASRQPVSLTISDIIGRIVAQPVNEVLAPGSHRVAFDGAGLSSGVYVATVRAGGESASAKMVFLK